MSRTYAGLRHLGGILRRTGSFQECRTSLDRRVLVQLHDGQFQAVAFELRHALDAQQRVAAEIEEVVVDTHTVDGEQVGPHVGQGLLYRGLWRGEGHVQFRPFHIRGGQCLAVDLATGCARQFLHGHEGGRLHVVGEKRGEVLAQVVRADLTLRDVVADEPLQSGTVLADVRHGLLHGRVFLQRHLHLTELDAVAAHLHLAIDAALVVDLAVGEFGCAIARTVEAATWGEGVGEETFRGEVITTDVARGHTGTAEVELTLFAFGNRLHLLIEHDQLHVVDGAADVRQCGPGRRVPFQLQLAHHVAFRRPVLIAEAAAGQLLEQVGDRRGDLQLLPAGEDLLQGGRHFAGAFHGFCQVL